MSASAPRPRVEGTVAVVDLHGYSTHTAEAAARIVVEEAWEHGCTAVRLIHGGGRSTRHWDELARGGYAAIKWRLREMLRRGDFGPQVEPAATRHLKGPGDLTIALRANPDADPHAPWTRLPARDYPNG